MSNSALTIRRGISHDPSRDEFGVSVALCTLNPPARLETTMTTLGAAFYLGFFVLAALWLFVTADGAGDQDQEPERSNSASTAVGPDGSSPWALTQSSLK